ncbi:hypothetical protein Mmc1_0816 [Magnetococcus marinus MC-1]|uniref:DUF1858 domain-containing protein n=1 Tax=Magnetococcus marinus (strain ATCC BAA-1437 / JCM 17883 / MC-1) TaxID=156889 RepID=A0L5U2_MAGMM|nr:DUF1858 domain-containing protein [Magnetococcus marinus]ABK43335.1 hypothetical protein Mmc1_0816 [Magnetococcus marinus MC-1]
MSDKPKQKSVSQLMEAYPGLEEALAKRGIECASCLASQVDTLGDVVRMYNIDAAGLLQEVEGLSAEEAGLPG